MMMMRTCLNSLVVPAMFLFGGMAAAQDADIEAEVEDLQQRFEEAVVAGDWEALGSLFAENAIFMPPTGGVIEGREGARQWHEESGITAPDIRSSMIEEVAENLFLGIGTWTGTLPEEAGGGTIEGEYVALVERGEDGLLLRSLTSIPVRQPPEAPAQ